MKKVISAAVSSALSWLAGSDNKYDGGEKKRPSQASSTNADKEVRLNITLKKAK